MEVKERADKIMINKLVDILYNNINFIKEEFSISRYERIEQDYNYLKNNKRDMNLISKIKFLIIERRIQSVLDLKQIEAPKIENGHGEFVNEMNPNNFNSYDININAEKKEPQDIVISDLHGDLDKWKKVKEYLKKNPNTNLIILGDAIDRGAEGINILYDIKEMSEMGKVVYLPGNHDAFAYNTLRAVGNERLEEIFDDDIQTWYHNGGEPTVEQFLHLKQEKMHELINWLGKQSIQCKITSGNKNYALSHAIFDEGLYQKEPYMNLEKAYEMKLNGCNLENNEMYRRFYNCLWYREGSFEPVDTSEMILPPSNETMVVGHTPQPGIVVSKINNTPIVYVDNSNNKGEIGGLDLGKFEPINIYSSLENER